MEIRAATANSSAPRRLPRFWPWLVVLLLLVLVGFIRVRLLDVPLERDEGEYAYAGQLLLQGIPPYELAYNMKLPGTCFIYALGMALFGQNIAGIHLLLLLANSLTIIFVFLLGRQLFGVAAGLAAGACYGILSASAVVYGTAAHATHFVVLFAVPATLVLLNAAESKRLRTFFFSGLLYGLAFFMKQPGICFGLFGACFLFGRAARDRSIFTRAFAGSILVFGLALVLPLALFCLFAVEAGFFGRFWFWTFVYSGSYAREYSLVDGLRNLGLYLSDNSEAYLGFGALAGTGLMAALLRKKFSPGLIFAVAFLGFSFLGTMAGLIFRPHYFILMLPAFAIVAGLAVPLLASLFEQKAKMIPAIVFAGLFAWTVYLHREGFFQMTPFQFCQAAYPGNPFVESLPVARYVREHSPADARLAVFGSEPQIYFYSGRHSATGYIYTYPLMENQTHAAAMQHEMINEIEAVKPEFMVQVGYQYSWLIRASSDATILRWFDAYAGANYERVGVVGVRPTGENVEVWDAEAGNFHDPLDHSITIYRRRPGPPAPTAVP